MKPPPALWDSETDVEVLEALPKIYERLDATAQRALVTAILAGPSSEGAANAYPIDDAIEHEVYVRLEALGESGRGRHGAAGDRFKAILDAHPSWAGVLAERIRRREPQVYSRPLVRTVEADARAEDVVAQILSRDVRNADDFHTLTGLSMATRGAAIQHATSLQDGEKAVRLLLNIRHEELADNTTHVELLRMLAGLPSVAAQQGYREVATILQVLSDRITSSSIDDVLCVWDSIIQTCLSTVDEVFGSGPPDHVTGAINSSSGRATQALFSLLGKTTLTRECGLVPPFRERLQLIVRSELPGAFYCRVLAASRLYLLTWLDLEWTKAELIPRLSWTDSVEAAGAWQGYLWNPGMDGRLFEAIRRDFVEAFSHVAELKEFSENLCDLLVSLALDAPGRMTPEETRQCLRAMGSPLRRRVAWLLAKRLEATDKEIRPTLWNDRIDSWISNHWPIENEFADGEVSDRLGWAATFAGSAFPKAVGTILPLVTPAKDPLLTLSAFEDLDLCRQYPDQCLRLLDALLGAGKQCSYLHGLGSALRAIRSARPSTANTPVYTRLKELAQTLGDAP